MAKYIDSTYVDNAIGDSERKGFTDFSSGNDDVLDQLIEDASALVDSVLHNTGHTVPLSGSAPQLVKRATLGALLPALYGRKGKSVPQQFLTEVRIFEAIRSGDLPIPSLTPGKAKGIGGAKFTDRSSTSSTGKPAVMKKLRSVF